MVRTVHREPYGCDPSREETVLSKRRFAAVAAAAAIVTSVAPATALATPALPGPLAGFSSIFGNSNPDNKSRGCHVDWRSSATKTRTDSGVTNTIDGGVTPRRGDNGATEMQLWGDFSKPFWRTIVATDGDIRNYKLEVKLPAGYAYTSEVFAADSTWFGIDGANNLTKWPKALGPDSLTVTTSTDTRTATVKVKSGTLEGLHRFVIYFTGTPDGSTVPDSITATAKSTGLFVDCGGNGSSAS